MKPVYPAQEMLKVKVLVALKHLTLVPDETKTASTPAPQLPKRKNGGDNDVKTEDSNGS